MKKTVKAEKMIHLGIIVKDAKKAAELYENEYGIGPWKTEEVLDVFANRFVNGQKGGIHMTTCTCTCLGFELELFSPKEDDCVFLEWLQKHGPTMHHIGLSLNESYEEALEHAERISGRKPYLDIKEPDGTPMLAYVDLKEEMGILLELHNE